MGADGGTIPKRCELVKKSKKKEKVTRDVQNASRWRICQLSQQQLRMPIVACRLGRLYNKEAVLEALVTKTIKASQNARHIRGVRDVRELQLTINPEYKEGGVDKGDVYKDPNISAFICPVTGLEMNGNQRFVVNWQCGCVISEKAVKEVQSDGCHSCGAAMEMDRVILNPTDEERAVYLSKMEMERSTKKNARCQESADSSTIESTATRKRKATNGPSSSSSSTTKTTTLQKDPSKSSAFKALFTTSEAAKRQPQQHWVTHNPLYY